LPSFFARAGPPLDPTRLVTPNQNQHNPGPLPEIREAAEQLQENGLAIGRRLCEIRDDELWREEGHESWNQYLKQEGERLVGKSFTQSARLIRAAEIHKRIPVPSMELEAAHYDELSRLAPAKETVHGGTGKDYSQISNQPAVPDAAILPASMMPLDNSPT
jgi:hypothetical protein